jgi:hypothetical protein
MSDDLYNGVMLRRWSIDTASGRAECLDDAVDVTLIAAEDRAAIEARNAGIHQAMGDVEAYEAALRAQEPEEQTIPAPEGEDTIPNPAYTAWQDAQALIAGASEPIRALTRLRSGDYPTPAEGEEPLFVREDDEALVDATWNTPIEIVLPSSQEIARRSMPALSPRQLCLVMLMVGLRESDLEQQIMTLVPDPVEQEFTLIEWRKATSIKRLHPMVEEIREAMNFDPVQFDDLWNFGLTLQ